MLQDETIIVGPQLVFQNPVLETMCAVAEASLAPSDKGARSFESFSNIQSISKEEIPVRLCCLRPVSQSTVEDVLPSTDFQSLAINVSLNQTRGWSNYLVFGFDGRLTCIDWVKHASSFWLTMRYFVSGS